MNRKAKWIIGVLSVLLIISWVGAGSLGSELSTAQADSDHWYSCSQQAIKAQATAVDSWNTLVGYQNAGYLVDDYTAGQLQAQIDNMNTSIENYNSNCAGNNPIPTVQT